MRTKAAPQHRARQPWPGCSLAAAIAQQLRRWGTNCSAHICHNTDRTAVLTNNTTARINNITKFTQGNNPPSQELARRVRRQRSARSLTSRKNPLYHFLLLHPCAHCSPVSRRARTTAKAASTMYGIVNQQVFNSQHHPVYSVMLSAMALRANSSQRLFKGLSWCPFTQTHCT